LEAQIEELEAQIEEKDQDHSDEIVHINEINEERYKSLEERISYLELRPTSSQFDKLTKDLKRKGKEISECKSMIVTLDERLNELEKCTKILSEEVSDIRRSEKKLSDEIMIIQRNVAKIKFERNKSVIKTLIKNMDKEST
jgi:chromosome segregation ATPase